jgi:hypothetical protein
LRIGKEKEASGQPRSSTNGPTNPRACGSITHISPPPPARSLPGSPDLIPDSEPNNSASASGEEVGSSVENLASVPSTVHVGSPGTSDEEVDSSTRLVRFPGGTWRNSNGSWSFGNFYYSDDDETPQATPYHRSRSCAIERQATKGALWANPRSL